MPISIHELIKSIFITHRRVGSRNYICVYTYKHNMRYIVIYQCPNTYIYINAQTTTYAIQILVYLHRLHTYMLLKIYTKENNPSNMLYLNPQGYQHH